jgi:hypothetical protein
MREMREIVKRGYEEGDYLKFYRLVEEMEEYPLAKANIDRMTAFLQNLAVVWGSHMISTWQIKASKSPGSISWRST